MNVDKVLSIELYSENITSIIKGSVDYHYQIHGCGLNEQVRVSPHIPILMLVRKMEK